MKKWIFVFVLGLFATGSRLASAQETANAAPIVPVAPSAVSGPTTTEITADQQTTFDQKTNKAIFRGHVKVVDPRFNLTCDELIAVLKGTSSKPAASATPSPQNAMPVDHSRKQTPDGASDRPKAKSGDQSSSINHVIAIGHVMIIQKKPEKDGKVTEYIGKAQRAEYDSKTGNIELSGWPSVQQGANLQVATSESTTMIMNRDTGAMSTNGPSKTVISQDNGAKP